jgi:hypothetical protein
MCDRRRLTMDRNSRPNFAAFAAEEERQRASEEAAREPHPAAEEVDWARTDASRLPNRTNKIFRRILRALGR